jgi:hypothetical protein
LRSERQKVQPEGIIPISLILFDGEEAIGVDSTRATRARGIATRDAGATWFMVTPPASSEIGDELLFDHYRQVAQQVALPVVVQDAREHTSADTSRRLLGWLAKEIGSVAGVKVEAPPSAPKVAAVAQEDGMPPPCSGERGTSTSSMSSTEAPGARFPAQRHRSPSWTCTSIIGQDVARRPGTVFSRHLPLPRLCTRTLHTHLFTQKEILRRAGVVEVSRLGRPGVEPDAHLLRELEGVQASIEPGRMHSTVHTDPRES